ncbi:MAG: DUF86 domain-containing protein [Sulfuricurvum sp.]|jgi:uncharacterized protein with HEPN domain|nr:DUF86 domain-containing protein [Sulfuricurvum sp.]MDP3021697.1 DUF86 domain-containing protein [Sulfuricurvum sp.]
MSRDWKLYLRDLIAECHNIRKFTANISFEEFTDNTEKVYATAKAFENIGEAVKQIPKEVQEEFAAVPWSEIAKMRDVLTHHYFGLDDKVLWDTLEEDFVVFESTIEQISKKYLD